MSTRHSNSAPGSRHASWSNGPAREIGWNSEPRRLVPRADRGPARRLPAGADERGRPAVHPLHLRFHRKAQRRAAHDRRLHGLCLDDPSVRLRLPRWRYLLVHGGLRLDHRPQLYRLRPAGQWRDHADLRRPAELPDSLAALGSLRQARGQYLLHRTDRHPRADARRG